MPLVPLIFILSALVGGLLLVAATARAATRSVTVRRVRRCCGPPRVAYRDTSYFRLRWKRGGQARQRRLDDLLPASVRTFGARADRGVGALAVPRVAAPVLKGHALQV